MSLNQTAAAADPSVDGEKIRHMTKIWHAGLAMKELGWL